MAELLRKLIFHNFCIFVVSGQGKHAASIGTILFFIGYPANEKYPPNRNCICCSSHKIVWKLACLGVKMTSLDRKQNCHESCQSPCAKIMYLIPWCKIVRKVAYLSVRKLCKSEVSWDRKCCALICVNKKIA